MCGDEEEDDDEDVYEVPGIADEVEEVWSCDNDGVGSGSEDETYSCRTWRPKFLA